jgi:hypothetical protein
MKTFTDVATFGLDQWRADLAYRNELIRTVALEIVKIGTRHLDSGIIWFKNFVGYRAMEANDRLLVRKHASFIRRIVKHWHTLDEMVQQQFTEGHILPSALYRLLAPAGPAVR